MALPSYAHVFLETVLRVASISGKEERTRACLKPLATLDWKKSWELY